MLRAASAAWSSAVRTGVTSVAGVRPSLRKTCGKMISERLADRG